MPFHHTTVWLILFDSWAAGWGPLSTLVLLKVFEILFRIISAYCGHIRINLIEPTVFSVHKPGISLFKVIFKRSSLYEIVGPKFKTKFDLYTVAHSYMPDLALFYLFFSVLYGSTCFFLKLDMKLTKYQIKCWKN